MKKKFSRMLGVGLTLVLLTSLLMTAAPVAADVSKVAVTVDPDGVSVAGGYVITFVLGEPLIAEGDTITVRFPADTDVPQQTVLNLASWNIAASPGWIGGVWDPEPVVAGITAASDADERTVTFTLDTGDEIGEGATVRIEFLTAAGIINPTEPGLYTLEVKTSAEPNFVRSESYETTALMVGGFVHVYNPAGILMATFGGARALNAAAGAGHFGKEDFTIRVGPGTYVLTASIVISGEGLTLESFEGAADTIIDARKSGARHTISIASADVTIDGFTIDDADRAIIINAADAIVTNNIITDATVAGIQIRAGGTNATVADNVIEDCEIGILFVAMGVGAYPVDLGDIDITGNTITETSGDGAIVFGGGNQDIDITGNTITGNDNSGIFFAAGVGYPPSDDILIEGNTISANKDHGLHIAATAPTNLVIRENDILDNENDGMNILSWTVLTNVVMFNNFSGNTDDNIDTAVDVTNARFNWWGSADEDDITAEFDGVGDVTYDPWLVDTWEAVVVGSKVATDADSLDARDEAGVAVSGIEDDKDYDADIISAFRYIANPEDAIADAIGFYDVFVVLQQGITLGEVTARLTFFDAAITEASTAYYWTGDFWDLASDLVALPGLVRVTVTVDTTPSLDELEGTAFAVVTPPAAPPMLVLPGIVMPEAGAVGVSLMPTFDWAPVPGADAYYFQLADNPMFVMPLISFEGDLARLIETAYTHVTPLDYATAYHWRVKAVSGYADALDRLESAWAEHVFITMDEPVVVPPIVIEVPPAITLDPPDIIFPPAEPIAPAWTFVMIGIGAVLVIGLLALIARARRAA